MLLSDRDLRAEIDAGAFGLDPFDPSLLQPSSIDVRLDRYFRVFNNSKYTHIDPQMQQDDLTTLVEVAGDEAFVLHPGEFVLGSTFEAVTLSDELAGTARGQVVARPARPAHALDGRASSTRGSPGTSRSSCRTSRTCRSRCGRG